MRLAARMVPAARCGFSTTRVEPAPSPPRRNMTTDEMARNAAQINFEVVIVHGLADCKVGFVWHDTFIHDPFVDPQYGAFPVDPAKQYGDAYRQSIFATDPAKALEIAQQQLRDRASEDFSRYCVDNQLDALATIESVCGACVAEAGNPLATLTDEQVARLWAHVGGIRE